MGSTSTSTGLCFKSNGKTIRITVGVVIAAISLMATAVAAWVQSKNDIEANTACMKKMENRVGEMGKDIVGNTNAIERTRDEMKNIKEHLKEIKVSQREQRQEYREDMKELKVLLRR